MKMRKLILINLAVFCLAVFSGCKSDLITHEQAMDIKNGNYTKKDILDKFGEPTEEEITSYKGECWTYRHRDYNMLKDAAGVPQKEKTSIVTICFDSYGNVSKVDYLYDKDWRGNLTW